jgi:hypothetical protein
MNQTMLRVIVAIALLAVLTVTVAALRESDRWRRPGRNAARQASDPYDGLTRLLAQGPAAPATSVRDPFRPENVRATTTSTTRRITVVPPAPVREAPVVTAIVVSDDGNPQAVIRYEGKSITVGAGGLFADYRVVSVTADAVVLERAGQQLVLKQPKKGD